SDSKARLNKLIYSELEDVQATLELIAAFKNDESYAELYGALKKEILRNCERIIAVICLLNNKTDYNDLYFWFIENRLINMEIPESRLKKISGNLETLNDSKIKKEIFYLLTTFGFAELLNKFGIETEALTKTKIEYLDYAAFGSEKCLRSWTRAIAISLIGKLKIQRCGNKLLPLLKDADFVIRESAAVSLYKLDKKLFNTYKQELKNDASPHIRRMIRFIEELK
ncbi:MAG TPA: hypothetical protein PKY81_09030, partial [bacterium]|nr:hypothetical protein [bacterium]